MIYRSNLPAPDIHSQFKHIKSEPEPGSLSHDVIRDWADGDYPGQEQRPPGCLTHDEAAILFNTAERLGGMWLDVGCHSGWTSSHIAAAGCGVTAVDCMFCVGEFTKRFKENTASYREQIGIASGTSDDYFLGLSDQFIYDGVMIDANHDAPCPLNDARNALDHLAEAGVIVFHDLWGRPIREGVEYLMVHGLRCRTYDTPAGMAVCWRGEFTPIQHTPDPAIDWAKIRRERAPEFDFGGTCS